jgi:hypothetical protein
LNKKGAVTSIPSTCDLSPLTSWDPSRTDDAISNWFLPAAAGSKPNPTWIAFAGDSETRYEFWRLVKMIGRGDYTVSDNFARVAFNVSLNKAKVEKDQDPVTVEAKFMDYKFCCADPAKPSSCHIETGGDNVTRIHASFRKVNDWLAKNVDFNDVGQATSSFLAAHRAGLCITWKMLAFPGPIIVSQVLQSHLSGEIQVLHAIHPPTCIARTSRSTQCAWQCSQDANLNMRTCH